VTRHWRRDFRSIAALIAVLVSVVSVPTGACAQGEAGGGLSVRALDSALVALRSPDWNERHEALTRINRAYTDALPDAVLPRLVELLAREAGEIKNHEGDEDFGEYLVDLVLTAVRTGDARAVPGILSVDGLGISSGVASFVASQGRAVMPALDSLAGTREDRASDVAETYALMYARHGSRLSRADSAGVLRRLLAVAVHESPVVRGRLAYVAGRGLLVELLPLVADLAVADTDRMFNKYIVREDAAEALPALQGARAGMPTAELLNRLALLTDAACGGGSAATAAACAELGENVAEASRQVAAGQGRLAVKALDAYSRTVRRLGAAGAVSRPTAVTLDGTARAVLARLAA
jgi:hypothetical protein